MSYIGTRRQVMQFFQKVGPVVVVGALVVLLLFSALPVSAAPPNRALAAKPAAVLQAIDAANLPDVPDKVAAEMRAKGWLSWLLPPTCRSTSTMAGTTPTYCW